MRSGRKLAWLIAAVVMAGAGCGRGGEVQTGSGAAVDDDAAGLVQRSVARALEADTYRVRVDTTVGGSTDASATGTPPCGFGEPGAARQIAVGDDGHRTALLDSRSGAVHVLRDDREPVGYLATATLPGAGDAPTEWARFDPRDLATTSGLTAIAPGLWSDGLFYTGPAADGGLLTTLQKSAATVSALDRGEIDGVAVSHQHITVDRQRLDAAEQDQRRGAQAHAPMFGMPPGTLEPHPSPTEPLPTFDTWVDDAGTLRRVVFDGWAPSGPDLHRLWFEITYLAFDEPFPAPMPAPEAATDLGSLPASVLLPLPDCLDINRAMPPPDNGVPPDTIAAFVEYTRCVSEARKQAAAGRTVTEWLEQNTALAFNGTCPLPPLFPR